MRGGFLGRGTGVELAGPHDERVRGTPSGLAPGLRARPAAAGTAPHALDGAEHAWGSLASRRRRAGAWHARAAGAGAATGSVGARWDGQKLSRGGALAGGERRVGRGERAGPAGRGREGWTLFLFFLFSSSLLYLFLFKLMHN
jgi:hypothetical protein